MTLLVMANFAFNCSNAWVSMNDALLLGHKVRGDFPILSQLYPMSKQEGAGARSPLSQVTYLDSAATSQKPRQVLDAIQVQVTLDSSTSQHRVVKS